MNYPTRNPWTDPNVIDARMEGRFPSDIAMIQCQRCSNWGYYNEGSHFTCSVCDWSGDSVLEDIIEEGGVCMLDDLTTEEGP